MKVKSKGCLFKNCQNKHKSDTGYCAEHVEQGMRSKIHVNKTLMSSGVSRTTAKFLMEEFNGY